LNQTDIRELIDRKKYLSYAVVVDLSQEGPGGTAFDMSVLDQDGSAPIDGGIQ
jgi:hypothetical protein